ncbi:MAG: phytanoyl-CoA dioxygenase family protein [Sphingomonadaceae bacterium]
MIDPGAQRRALAEDGAIHIPGLIPPGMLPTLAAIFDWSIANPSNNAHNFEPTPASPGRFYADINNPMIPRGGSPYDALLVESHLGDVLKELWGSRAIWFLYEQVLLKEGGATRRTPWHQDSSYLPIKGDMIAVIWITLEETPAENALEFVQASHRGPLYDGSAFDPADDTVPVYGDGSMPRLPDIEADRGKWPILSWDVQPGDALVFHPATLHGGAPTRAGYRRRTLSLRFFGEDATYQPRSANGVRGIGIEGETIWDKLGKCLKPGDPLRHSDFLQVRYATD